MFPRKGLELDKVVNTVATEQADEEYNVCLQGAALDMSNQGCSALTASLVKLLTDSKPNARINLLYGSRSGGVRNLTVSGRAVKVNVVNCRLSPKAKINEHLFWILFLAILQRVVLIRSVRRRIIESNRWLRTLHTADFVGEIRGGDSFSDIYGLRKFLIGIIPCMIAILMRKEIVLLPQTYGPFNSRFAKLVARFIVRRAARLYSRDKDSIEVVHDLLGEKGKHKTVQICPDVAFVLESVLPEEPDIQPEHHPNTTTPLIGLNISSLLYGRERPHNDKFGLRFEYKEFVPLLLQRLMEQTNAHVLLVPHVGRPVEEGGEFVVSREVAKSVDKQYSTRLHLVQQQYDQNEIKGIIGLCDFFIGSRMHACIAALSQGIPAIGLAYSKKFQGVFQSVGVEQFSVDMRERGPEEIIETVITAFEQRSAIAENLKATIPEAKKQVWHVFKGMCSAKRSR